jgi:hypothetical protein
MASQLTSLAIAERFTIGRVLSLSWHAWLACRWHLLLIVAPVAALRVMGGSTLLALLPKSVPSAWKEMIGVWTSAGILTPAIACLTCAAVRYAADQPLHPSGVLRASWRRIPVAVIAALIVQTMVRGPIFLISDSGTIVFAVGYLAYAAYALAVATVTFLLVPVLMLERTSVAGALDRCIQLTSGHRWQIVALALLVWMALSLVAYVYRAWIVPWYPVLGDEVVYLVRISRTFFTISITSCLSAATYYLLRSEKQGPSPGMIARVFD